MRTKDSQAQGRHVRRVVHRAILRGDGEKRPRIEGAGVLYNTVTTIGEGKWAFEEVVAPGAFRASLSDENPRDILSRMNHREYLGRTANATLRLTDTEEALMYSVEPNMETTAGRDAVELARRGDFGGASFEFIPTRTEYRPGTHNTPERVTIMEAKLFEVGPVMEPAYSTTTADLRALRDACQARHTREQEDEEWEWRLRSHRLLQHQHALTVG